MKTTSRIAAGIVATTLTIAALGGVGHAVSASQGSSAARSATSTAPSVSNPQPSDGIERAITVNVPSHGGAAPRVNPVVATSSVTDARMLHRPGQAVAGTDTGQWSSMYDFMSYVVQDASVVWSWYYKQWNRQQISQVNFVFPLPGQRVSSPCGWTDDTTMMYCPTNDTIYFSQALATRLWNGSYVGPDGNRGIGGDFAVATMLAHEYGHNAQNELGLLNPAANGAPKTEQQADCFSGAFAHVAYYQGILDPNDVNEGLATAFSVGDSAFTALDHHGTGAQRIAAWKLGYNGAGPAVCDAIMR